MTEMTIRKPYVSRGDRRLSLDEFIQQCLTDEQKGKCTRFSLCQMLAGEGKREVYSHIIGAGPAAPTEWADMFEDMAAATVQDIPGVHTFNLFAFYEGKTIPERFHTIIKNSVRPRDGSLATENPDERGRTAQGMRQLEASYQQMYRKQEHLDMAHERLVSQLLNVVTTLREENHEAHQLVHEFTLKQITANNEHEQRMREYQRSSQERMMFLKFLPALANSLLNTEVFPQSTEDTVLIESFFDAFPADSLKNFLGMSGLDDKQKAAIISRAMRHDAKRKEEELKAKQLYAPTAEKGAGEDDVRGETALTVVEGGKK